MHSHVQLHWQSSKEHLIFISWPFFKLHFLKHLTWLWEVSFSLKKHSLPHKQSLHKQLFISSWDNCWQSLFPQFSHGFLHFLFSFFTKLCKNIFTQFFASKRATYHFFSFPSTIYWKMNELWGKRTTTGWGGECPMNNAAR